MIGLTKTKFRIFLTDLLGKDLVKISQHMLDEKKIISFDVFDTLIIRPGYIVPTDLFNIIYPADRSFKEKRIVAERMVRQRSLLEDIKLKDIYRAMYPDDPAKSQEGEELETKAELSVCKANASALEFFNYIKSQGKKIIITSDMYLEQSIIEKILEMNGYNLDGVNIYVSSEIGLTKKSGNLYRKIIQEENIESNKILHIGDNFISDYIKPKLCGIQSFLYRRES